MSDGAAEPWEWRMRVYPVAIIVALAATVVLAATANTGTGGPDRRLGGDYPAFYAAGEIARNGDWDHLYDAGTQQAAQSGLLDDAEGFLYFAYPPPVAAVYAPLAGLAYRWSYLAHTLLMALALWGAIAMARPMVPLVDRFPVAAFAGALLTYPLFRAVTGGQNTALTLLLVVAAARFEREGRLGAAGIAVGLMLYKPQFGVVFLVLLIVRRQWKSVASASVVAGAMWAVSAVLIGADWVNGWWSQAAEFARLNADVNAPNVVSLPGALGHVLGTAGDVVGWLGAAVLVGGLVALWWRVPGADPRAIYAFTAAVAVLALPQPLFYEAGLVVFLGALVVGRHARSGLVLAGTGAAVWIQPISGSLGSLPLTLVVAAFTIWAGSLLWLEFKHAGGEHAPAI
jgi:hypothetical protein